MSRTICLKGSSPYLSANFYPPLRLDPNFEHGLALTGFHSFNSIPNVEEGVNNKIYLELENGQKKVISIPTGSYSINDLEYYIQTELTPQNADYLEKSRIFSLKPNGSTLKCELQSIYTIDFSNIEGINTLLGFSSNILERNILHQSDLPVCIRKVNSIRIDCNLVTGSYQGNKPSHTLFQFTPNVDAGYALNIEPNHLIYLPLISANFIDNISIEILDQESRAVNFRGEEIIIKLELKSTPLF